AHDRALDFDLAERSDELGDDLVVHPQQPRGLHEVGVRRFGRFHATSSLLEDIEEDDRPTSGNRPAFSRAARCRAARVPTHMGSIRAMTCALSWSNHGSVLANRPITEQATHASASWRARAEMLRPRTSRVAGATSKRAKGTNCRMFSLW